MASKCNSYLMRMKAARKVHGKAANTATRLSFQPNMKAISMQPSMLNVEIIGNAPFSPTNSWICFGSVANRDTREPDAFSFNS